MWMGIVDEHENKLTEHHWRALQCLMIWMSHYSVMCVSPHRSLCHEATWNKQKYYNLPTKVLLPRREALRRRWIYDPISLSGWNNIWFLFCQMMFRTNNDFVLSAQFDQSCCLGIWKIKLNLYILIVYQHIWQHWLIQLPEVWEFIKPHYCTIALLHYCTIALLHYCIIALLHYCTIALLHYCTIALLHYCIIALLHYCTIALLHYCIIALLHYCTIALLHYCTIALLHYSAL